LHPLFTFVFQIVCLAFFRLGLPCAVGNRSRTVSSRSKLCCQLLVGCLSCRR